MNCDECKDRVFELVDAERIDPEAVREVLGRCPECRALFEETKATLELASDLPIVDPSAVVDQAVLRAARAHATKVVPAQQRRFRPAPWAAAAVALLALSVGVWSIPETKAPTSEPVRVPIERPEEPEGRENEEQPSTERMMRPADDRAAAPTPAAKRPARPVAERSSTTRQRLKAGVEHDEEVMQGPSETGVASDQAAAPASSGDVALKAEPGPAMPCSRRLAEVEKKGRDATGEDALDLGRCYRDAKDYDEARRWLERATNDPKTKRRATRILKSLPQR